MPGVYDRRMFRMANGGMMPPEGGLAGLEAAEFATPEQESEIYQAAEGLPPEVLEEADRGMEDLTQQLTMQQVSAAADSEAQRSIQNLGSAGDFRGIMNAVWDDDADIEAYRDRLAAVVGPEDAGRTPDSVLALVQPTLQLAEIDKGVGSLMQEELAEIGGMGGGITELATKSAVADAMAAETGALVDRVGGMSQGQGPSGIMGPGQESMGIDPEMMQAMMQGAGPTGQGMV